MRDGFAAGPRAICAAEFFRLISRYLHEVVLLCYVRCLAEACQLWQHQLEHASFTPAVGQVQALALGQQHCTFNRALPRACWYADHLRQQEDDDCVLVEPEEPADWILQQLRGGPSSHTPGRRYFNILYEDKDEAKEYGARWDVQAREWCVQLVSCLCFSARGQTNTRYSAKPSSPLRML